MKKITVGYLPLFVKLYDDDDPHYRDPLVEYMNKLVSMLEAEGIEVIMAEEVCRVKEEFKRAADRFNALGVDAVITQHLAYSPSLESIDALLSLEAPIVIFDTTPDYGFLREANYRTLMRANHGIHGVQDMCNLLARNERKYWLCVGHALHGNGLNEVVSACRAAAMAKAFKTERIGSVAGYFEGMGDFVISDERYKNDIGAEVLHMDPETAKKLVSSVTEKDIDDEIKADANDYYNTVQNEKAYRDQTKWGLALRKWVEEEKLDAVSVNFQSLTRSGFGAMPFVECSKLLANGKGYAGEGDILTAGLLGALNSVYHDTTFVEMFCPDWENDLIFISHMGEMNPKLAQWKPSLVDCPMGGESGDDTVYVIGCAMPGKAVYVNLAPMKESFRLIITEVEMTDDGRQGNFYDNFRNQGWIKPCKPLPEFLKEFSMLGGTHHSTLVYGGDVETIKTFGEMMGFEVAVIR